MLGRDELTEGRAHLSGDPDKRSHNLASRARHVDIGRHVGHGLDRPRKERQGETRAAFSEVSAHPPPPHRHQACDRKSDTNKP